MMKLISNSKFQMILCSVLLGAAQLMSGVSSALAQSADKLEAYHSYPQPDGMTSSDSKLAWTFNERGQRNVFVAEAPNYQYRKLTQYSKDIGQEINHLAISSDGKYVVFVKGGEHGGNWSQTVPANPASLYETPPVQLWSVPFNGGNPVLLGNGSFPALSPDGQRVAFIASGQVWTVPIDGSAKAEQLFKVRGTVRQLQWSPSGQQLAFSVSRSSHAFIGVYHPDAESVRWVAPAFSNDQFPVWSPDEQSIAFIRLPGSTKELDAVLERKHSAWEIQVADVATGQSRRLWKAPETLAGSVPTTDGRFNLHWVAGDRIVFLSYHDGWPHLYSVPAGGGQELLLTAGDFMIEQLKVSADRTKLLFSANTGSDPQKDIDRRHIAMVSVDQADMRVLTSGSGAETMPVFANGGKDVAFLSSTPSRPPLPAVLKAGQSSIALIAEDLLPAEFPEQEMVTPEQVIYTAPDGMKIHAQLFEKKDGKQNKPAILFVHGGPQRQMMLSWDHRSYYAHTYTINQYLANEGYVVLSINYRLGIGYGFEFHRPPNSNVHGASEYLDVKAGGEWLAAQPQVDAKRIGVYGGSYGGYLTALALGKDSDLFAAGVDIHGVHNRVPAQPHTAIYEQAPDAAKADRVAWESSPIAYVDTWSSPVLFIHADDDRNVDFLHSVDLARRLDKRGVEYEVLAIPDDNHHWMLYRNLIRVSRATIEYFNRKL